MTTADAIAGGMCDKGAEICIGPDPTKAWEDLKAHAMTGCRECMTALVNYYDEIGKPNAEVSRAVV